MGRVLEAKVIDTQRAATMRPTDKATWKGMPLPTVLEALERLAERAGFVVEYGNLHGEDVPIRGGHFQLRGKRIILMDRKAGERECIGVLSDALREEDLGEFFILPAIRELIESTDPEA